MNSAHSKIFTPNLLLLNRAQAKVAESFVNQLRRASWNAQGSANTPQEYTSRLFTQIGMMRHGFRSEFLKTTLGAVCDALKESDPKGNITFDGSVFRRDGDDGNVTILVRDEWYGVNRVPKTSSINPRQVVTVNGIAHYLSKSTAYRCFESRTPIFIPNTRVASELEDPTWLPFYENQNIEEKSMVCFPIWLRPTMDEIQTIAVMTIDSNTENVFNQDYPWQDILRPFIFWLAIAYELDWMANNVAQHFEK
jgi:hypothetical protein